MQTAFAPNWPTFGSIPQVKSPHSPSRMLFASRPDTIHFGNNRTPMSPDVQETTIGALRSLPYPPYNGNLSTEQAREKGVELARSLTSHGKGEGLIAAFSHLTDQRFFNIGGKLQQKGCPEPEWDLLNEVVARILQEGSAKDLYHIGLNLFVTVLHPETTSPIILHQSAQDCLSKSFEKATAEGDARLLNSLGGFYNNLKGADKQAEMAFREFLKAARPEVDTILENGKPGDTKKQQLLSSYGNACLHIAKGIQENLKNEAPTEAQRGATAREILQLVKESRRVGNPSAAEHLEQVKQVYMEQSLSFDLEDGPPPDWTETMLKQPVVLKESLL